MLPVFHPGLADKQDGVLVTKKFPAFENMNPAVTSSFQNYNRYTYALNNPLKYTDPTGYNNENSGATYINPYAFPGYQGYIGPGSGNYWTDYVRTEYGNYMLMSRSTFNHFYGEGSTDIAGQITSNPTALEKWKDGDITLSMIRRDGGFWVDY